MKEKTKGIIIGALAATVLTGAVMTATADEVLQSVQIAYNNIKICIDGTFIEPKDAAGNVVEPFTLNGTTYLPVRAVAGAFGKDVDWDGETNTVYLGAKPGEITVSLDPVDVSNYLNGDVWNKGFWYIRNYVDGSYTDYLDSYISDFAETHDEEFNIEKIRAFVLGTKAVMEQYNLAFASNPTWEKLYKEYNRLYDIVEKSEYTKENFNTTLFTSLRDEFLDSLSK